MTCLVVNHENTTWNYYRGRDRAFLLPTAIFRPGGAAALLSNRCERPLLMRAHTRLYVNAHLRPVALPLFSATSWVPWVKSGLAISAVH